MGGGNGYGDDNPGANVGYYNTSNKEDNPYGPGTTEVNVYGGKINHIFGGSNTLGLIRTSATVNVDSQGKYSDDTEAEGCELKIGEVYSSGNEAPIKCQSYLNINCVDYIEAIYGGSRNADVGTPEAPLDVVLNINSGTFGKIFGGNNQGGELNAGITINIDETGCKPVIIGEVYGCGNNAAYTKPTTKPNPTINIISCTSIGNVFGGGKGQDATVTGNPIINVQQIPGYYNPTTHAYNLTNQHLGTIGNIYGGGNLAQVQGNTTVNIATKVDKQAHVLKETDTATYDVGANITGNVYGGGNKATVSGTTNVTIGHKNN